jgi:MraZ protein
LPNKWSEVEESGGTGNERPPPSTAGPSRGHEVDFTGEYRHSIDTKGRLIVPSAMREPLGETVYLSRWMENCIALWSEQGWADITDRLRSLPPSQVQARRFLRLMSASAHRDTVDKQGRINVPQKLREIAGITRDAVVIGVLDHAEIWDPDRYEQQEALEQSFGFEALAEDLQF